MTRLEEIRETIVPVILPCGVKQIAIFGSVSRGEDTPDSDVDILVALKDLDDRPPIGLKWFAIEQELSRLLGRKVDLVSKRGLSPYIRDSVEKDMVVLYDEG